MRESIDGDPLAAVRRYFDQFKVALRPGLPRFAGGLAGYFGYDTVRVSRRNWRAPKPDDLGVPDILLLLAEEVAVIDNLAGRIYLIVYADPRRARGLRARTPAAARSEDAAGAADRAAACARQRAARGVSRVREDRLPAAVARAKEYIAAGDVMQVQVGQRIRKPYADSPLSLYRALRTLNPSPYMYFYNFGDFHVVGASPEILVRSEDRARQAHVAIRPIAGTRPRGDTPEQDDGARRRTAADPKERAEHLMLIDLARNDIGRIVEIGSVKVTEQYVIEKYSHVQHLVSHVEGVLQAGMSNLDVLRATFPAGTLSGAPKVRAMEIIDELEPVKRGIYGGAVGYLCSPATWTSRSRSAPAVIKGNVLYAQAAAGIVADSVAENEWKETEVKARAVLRAAEQVEDGFDADA